MFGAVILSFGHEPRFLRLLDEITAVIEPRNVVIAHNPYSPQDLWMPTVPNGAVVIRMPDNVGYAQAMNAGIAALSSEWVLLLTHDVEIDQGQLRRLLSQCDSLPSEVGVAAPSLVFPDGNRSFGSKIDENGWVGHFDEPPTSGAVVDVPFVDGSAMLVRREAWQRVGGLCPRYFMYFEEPDLCDRARSAGWRTVVLTEVRVRSAPGRSGRPAAYGFLYARNGYDWASRMRGSQTARKFALSQIRHIHYSMPYHRGRWRPSVAIPAVAMAVGRALGLAAAVSGRVNGRPPGYLTRWSDIAGR
jgi:GT2 family glycosyltransferase